jgi:transcriptional regulator with XRE-family HTH domain
MFLAQNLKFLRTKSGLSQQALADRLNIARSSLAEYERGKTQPSIETLILLAEVFDIRIDDLIRKNLTQTTYELMRNKELKILAITVDRDKKENIELVDTKAEAGYLESAADPEYIKELPKLYFPGIPEGTYRAFEIHGESMFPLEPGSIVICSYVEKPDYLRDGKTYVIISQREGVVYKRVKVNKDRNTLTLLSDNPTYIPYELHLGEIQEIWQYYAHLSFTDSKTLLENMLDDRINTIHKKVSELHAKYVSSLR